MNKCEFEGYHSFEGCKPNALFLYARYPHPKSLPSGKGLTLALAGSKSGVSHLRNFSYLKFRKLHHIEAGIPVLPDRLPAKLFQAALYLGSRSVIAYVELLK